MFLIFEYHKGVVVSYCRKYSHIFPLVKIATTGQNYSLSHNSTIVTTNSDYFELKCKVKCMTDETDENNIACLFIYYPGKVKVQQAADKHTLCYCPFSSCPQ